MNQAFKFLETGALIRRALFFVVLAALAWIHLMLLYRGLGTEHAMDQAQIARQVSRGEGLTTKNIRPLEYHLAETKEGAPVSLVGLRDTYHAPLNPMVLGAVFKIVGADNFKAWEMNKKELIYPLDRVVSIVSTAFFIMSIGVTYLLICKLFDAKIAGVTAVFMLLCDLYWQYSVSGLPQMLLLLLFSCGMYFTYRTVEKQEEGDNSLLQPTLASIFFTLMVLTHWITAWIFAGFIIYAAITFRPRGVVAAISLVMVLLAAAPAMYFMNNACGEPFGVARFVFYNGLSSGSESSVMRTVDLSDSPLVLNGLMVKVLSTTLVQATDLIPFLGGILAAPIFFVALLHPFKSASIAKYRWAVALMWLFAAIGMAIFGISAGGIHPNQIHMLFAPIMAAYGLAFVSILWARLDVVTQNPFLRNAHFIVLVALSASPILLSLPRDIRLYTQVVDKDKGGWPQWPPYYPLILNKGIAQWVNKSSENPEIVVSDQPWAVAWYADVPSLWLPKSVDDFQKLDTQAIDRGTRFSGILITPRSRDGGPSNVVAAEYGDFAPLVFDGRVASITTSSSGAGGISLYVNNPSFQTSISEVVGRFPVRTPLIRNDMIYYSEAVPTDSSLQD